MVRNVAAQVMGALAAKLTSQLIIMTPSSLTGAHLPVSEDAVALPMPMRLNLV